MNRGYFEEILNDQKYFTANSRLEMVSYVVPVEDKRMRGRNLKQQKMFSYLSVEDRIPETHPLRAIKARVNLILDGLSHDLDLLYSESGRPSIPPEQLLRALMLQILFTIRSERQLMVLPERIVLRLELTRHTTQRNLSGHSGN